MTNEWLSVREDEATPLVWLIYWHRQDVYKLLLFVKHDGFAGRLHTLMQINEYLSYFRVKSQFT